MPKPIPSNRPLFFGTELDYVRQAVEAGTLQGDGAFSQRCQRWLEERYGIRRVLLLPSCTAALDLAATLCGFEEGDEVILPSFTFVSTASTFLRAGVRLRFVEIQPEDMNLDVEQVARAISPRTRAVVPMHYAGVGCEMDALSALAQRNGFRIVEDAAQGMHATYRGRWLGSLGALATFSFHETKNVECGQGGALCVNDAALVQRAEILSDKGTNRRQFLRGEIPQYEWVDLSCSHPMSEIHAAFLWAQLERIEEVLARRQALDRRYRELLAPLEAAGNFRMGRVPSHCSSNYHIFYLSVANAAARETLIAHLRKEQIAATFHYVPLHLSPMGRKLGYRPGDLPVTEECAARQIRLPLYFDLTDEEQLRVVEAIRAFYNGG